MGLLIHSRSVTPAAIANISKCTRHCEIVIERERARGLEICDRRNE
jgi:hypothetical protein